jgi:plastocyanin
MRKLAALIIILIGIAFTCGCTAEAPSQNSQPQATRVANQVTYAVTTPVPNGPTTIVHVTATSFDPWNLEIKTGTTVTWVNEDQLIRHVEHLPTEATGKELFNSGPLSKGDTFSYTFNTPGRYMYGDPQHGGGRSPYVNVSG